MGPDLKHCAGLLPTTTCFWAASRRGWRTRFHRRTLVEPLSSPSRASKREIEAARRFITRRRLRQIQLSFLYYVYNTDNYGSVGLIPVQFYQQRTEPTPTHSRE